MSKQEEELLELEERRKNLQYVLKREEETLNVVYNTLYERISRLQVEESVLMVLIERARMQEGKPKKDFKRMQHIATGPNVTSISLPSHLTEQLLNEDSGDGEASEQSHLPTEFRDQEDILEQALLPKEFGDRVNLSGSSHLSNYPRDHEAILEQLHLSSIVDQQEGQDMDSNNADLSDDDEEQDYQIAGPDDDQNVEDTIQKITQGFVRDAVHDNSEDDISGDIQGKLEGSRKRAKKSNQKDGQETNPTKSTSSSNQKKTTKVKDSKKPAASKSKDSTEDDPVRGALLSLLDQYEIDNS